MLLHSVGKNLWKEAEAAEDVGAVLPLPMGQVHQDVGEGLAPLSLTWAAACQQHSKICQFSETEFNWGKLEMEWLKLNKSQNSCCSALHELTQICFSRFMVKPPHGAQPRLELLSASLIPWLVFLFPGFSAGHFFSQRSKGWKSTLKQLLINSCISKLHRSIMSERCKHKMILHRANYFPIWNTESLSNSFKTLIVVEHPVCSINYSHSQLENHCY